MNGVSENVSVEKIKKIAFWLVIGLFLGVFFMSAHSLVPYDADDWTYVGNVRIAVPYYKTWNPIKVLPEMFEGLCGYLAAYFVYPINGNIVKSLTFVLSGVYSLFIFIYVFRVSKFFSGKSKGIVTVLFLLMHFIIFKTQWIENKYMFGADNSNAVYNYTIPALLNCITISCLRSKDKNKNSSLLFLLIYLSVFSNLFNSIILASYAGVEILFNIISTKKIRDVFSEQKTCCGIILLWISSLVIEKQGGRASAIGQKGISLYNTVALFIKLMGIVNVFWWAIFFVACGICVFLLYKKNIDVIVVSKLLCLLIINFVYVVLLCGVTSIRYILRPEVLFGTIFYLFLLICYIYNVFLEKFNFQFVCYVALLILFSQALNIYTPYRCTNAKYLSEQQAMLVSEDIVNQVISADLQGQTEVEIVVPIGYTEDNWPHALYMGERLSSTLFALNVTSQKMSITVVPSQEMNDKYNIVYEETPHWSL